MDVKVGDGDTSGLGETPSVVQDPGQGKPSASSPQTELPDRSLDNQKISVLPPGGSSPPQSGRAVQTKPPPSAHRSSRTKDSGVSGAMSEPQMLLEELLMAPTPAHILAESKEAQDREWAETKEPLEADFPSDSTKPEAEQPPFMEHKQHDEHANEQEEKYDTTEEPPPERDEPEAMAAGDSASKPQVGPPLCEGDTTLTQNFLPPALVAGLFERLGEEVHFKKMTHQGGEVPRFVAVQGTIAPDGTQPVYRHPADESPPLAAFTPAVQFIRANVEKQLGHPVNHVLIQCYRNGNDHISEHSDKTLDVDRWSYIANVSIGAMRTMVFRTKRGDKKDVVAGGKERASGSSTPLEAIDEAATSPIPTDILRNVLPLSSSKRQTTRCPMPHNSLIKMGLHTNEKWLHGIRPDKRLASEKSASELAWHGMRISLTFRHITTFLSPSSCSNEPLIWGQGAVSKTREHARPVVNGQTPDAVTLLKAFGRENNSPDFDWEANYGRGFDVLHMKAAPRYFGCGDGIVDGRVRIMLAECGVKYARGDIGMDARRRSVNKGIRGADVGEVLPVRFVIDDADNTTVVGDVAILLFLDAKHPHKRGSDSEIAGVYSRFHAAIALEQRWKGLWASASAAQRRTRITRLKPHLTELAKWAAEVARHKDQEFEATIADYALWPVLHDVAVAWKTVARGRGMGGTVFEYWGLQALDGYYREFAERSSVLTVFGANAVASVSPEPISPADTEGESEEEDEEEDSEDTDNKPGKGKLPKLTEFGGNGL